MDDITLVNAALAKAGCQRITTLTEASAEAEVANANFDERRRFVLSLHPWRFATRQVTLSRLTVETPPDSRYDAAYQLPEAERILGVYVNDCAIEFDRLGRNILCNALETDLVTAEIVGVPPVDHWPGYAVAILIEELAGIFAMAIQEDASKAQLMAQLASRSLTNAKTADSQGRTAAKMPVGRFRRFVAGGTR